MKCKLKSQSDIRRAKFNTKNDGKDTQKIKSYTSEKNLEKTEDI